MKTTKVCKLISLLLAILMVVGTVPIQVFAATDETSVQWYVPQGKDSKIRYQDLRKELEKVTTSKKYIRLENDIDFSYDCKGKEDWVSGIKVKGDVTLDLNGHTLEASLYKGTADSMEAVNVSMFVIEKGNSLTVRDKKNSGRIATDGYIVAADTLGKNKTGVNVFNIFEVNGGSLTVNAAGAEFECGRSKKQYVTSSQNGAVGSNESYTGNIRGQSCGSVIKASANANITIVSGALKARGYEKINTNRFDDRCAVIKVTDDSSINIKIYDGTFYGKGCADALQLNDKTNIKVLSGVFDVHKVDRVAISAFSGSVRKSNSRYAVGSYGKIGLPDSAYDKTLAEVIVGGHNYSEDETESSNTTDTTTKCTEIKPKSNTKTADKAVSVKSKTGVNAWNCAKDKSFIIECESSKLTFGRSGYEVFYGELKGKSSFVGKYRLTLCDAATLKPIEGLNALETAIPEKGGKVEFDIADFYYLKTSTKYDFVKSEISEFAVKCEIEEVWNGEHKYTSTYFNYCNFSLTQRDLSGLEGKLDFSVVAKNVNPAKGFNTQYEVYQADENMETILEEDLDVVLDYSYKISKLQNGKPVEFSEELFIAKNEQLDNLVYFQSAGWGVITVICDYKFTKPSGDGYDVMRVEKQVFAMPSPTVTIVDANGNTVKGSEYAYKSWFDLEDGQFALIKAGEFAADIDKYGFTDKNGKKLSLSDIKWEISTESDDDGKDIWSNYTNVTNGEIKTNQSGKYRAKITYNGVTYYSPFEVLVKGKFYGSNQQAVLSGPSNGVKKFNDGGKIKIVLNEDDAYWNTNGYSITKIELQLISKPKGASTAYTKTENQWGIFNPDSFFSSSAKEEDIVPGEYVFVGTVEGTKPNGTYKVKTAEYTLTYVKDPTDIAIAVNGETVYTPGKTKVPYYFPWDRTTVQFSSSVWPADATPTSWAKNVPVWKSSDTSILQIDPGTGVATIKKPGKVTVTVEYRGADKTQSQSIDVYIPIVGYEMEPTDFSKFVGKKYSEVTGTIRSVWCMGGEKVTTDTDKYLKAEVVAHSDATGNSFDDYKVVYDNDGKVTWKISPVGGNILPLDARGEKDLSGGKEICYAVADYRMECNGVGNYDSINTVKAYGGFGSDEDDYRHEIIYSSDEFNIIGEMYILLYETPEIKNPNVEYIDTVNITVKEPTVGDARYEGSNYRYGTGSYYPEFMIMNIAGTAAALKDNVYSYSQISKITTLKGSGEPYTNASAEGSLTEYMNVWNFEGDGYTKPLKPTKKYENGTYVNDVKLEFDTSLGDGKEYRIARDVKVYINGHLIDFAEVGYSKTQSKITDSYVYFKYYFTVGEVETVNEVKLSGFAEDVKQGDMPIGIDDLKVLVDDKERDDIYISSFVWYDDVNSNGKYDANVDRVCESSSYTKPYTAGSVQFAPDGSFLAGKSYKLHLEIASDGKVKFGENFKIKFAENLNYGNKPEYSGQVIDLTFKPYPIVYSFNAETVDNLKTSGDKFKYQPKNEQFGFTCTEKSVINKKNANVIDSALTNGEYVYRAVYTAANGFSFNNACATGFKVNGKSIAKGSYKLENGSTIQTGVTVSSDGKTLTVVYPFTVTDAAETTATLSGTITSSGNAADKITVQLIKNGETKAAYTTTVTGNSAKFTFTNVKYGTYTLKVTKNNHITFEQKITVNNANVTKNVTLNHVCDKNKDGKVTEHTYGKWIYTALSRKVTRECSVCHNKETRLISLLGDSNGDGVLAAADARITLRASVGLEPITDALMETSDINRDGTITASDARSILRASVELEKLCND